MIGIAADETERQRETLPRVVRRVAHRVVIYYVGAVFILGLNVSVNDKILEASYRGDYYNPFALMIDRAGIPVLGNIINAVALIASLSVANGNLYMSVIVSGIRLSNNRVGLYTLLQTKAKHFNF